MDVGPDVRLGLVILSISLALVCEEEIMTVINKPTHPKPNKNVTPGPKDGTPLWWAGTNYIRIKKYAGGTKHSGPSGRRAERYRPPVAKKV